MKIVAKIVGRTALALVCVALLVAFGGGEARAESDAAAERYVEALVAQAVAILKDEEKEDAEKQQAFQMLLRENVDRRRLPAFLLGQYARLPDDAQKRAYLELLERFMARIYFVRLRDYADEPIRVTGSRVRKNGREVVVVGQIRLRGRDEPLSLDWWLLRQGEEAGDGFRVFDVRVGGIWLAQEQRSGFASVIRQNQQSFDAFLGHLREEVGEPAASEGGD